jgi:hypothetical protein
VLASDDILGAATLQEVFRENAFPAFRRRHGIEDATFFNLGVGLAGSSVGAGRITGGRRMAG